MAQVPTSGKRLIVNADDYGRTSGVSAGIRAAHLRGIVTSTTVMMNMPSAAEDLRRLKADCPGLATGIHLVLTAGRSIRSPEKVSTLTRADGTFPSIGHLAALFAQLDPLQLRDEWRSQIEAGLECGLALDHLDSHHHVSFLDERVFEVFLRLAGEYGLAIRYPLCALWLDSPPEVGTPQLQESVARFVPALLAKHPARYPMMMIGAFYGEEANLGKLLELLRALPEGASELMCHPGYADGELRQTSSYSVNRETELAALTNPLARDEIARQGISLITFGELTAEADVERQAGS